MTAKDAGKTWVLGWGEQVEVVEPASLREEIAGELGRAAGKYRG